MQEKLKGFLDKGKQWWSKTTKKTKMLLGAGLLVTLAAIAAVTVISLNRPYVTLFTDLNQTDMNAIVSYLADNGVTDYRISGEDTVLVPKEQEASLKADLLLQGYPHSGYAYSTYFDHVGSLTTESERNQLVLYELQDRTAMVIRSMEGVRDAVVQITPGESRTYVLDSGNVVEASAYVMVTMEEGRLLEKEQAEGIRNLVSRAVQGLKIENVSIVDAYGNTYAAGNQLTDLQDTTRLKLQLEEQVNNTVRTNIMQVLTPLYGPENVRVSVNSCVDVDRSYTDSTRYTPPEGSTEGQGIIGRKIYDQQVVRDEPKPAGGVAGSESNADIPTYVEDNLRADGSESLVQSSGENEYLVDQSQQQTEHIAGTVSDLMVSVTINADAAGTISESKLCPHIARAAGIGSADQQEKIHILTAPFWKEGGPVLTPGGQLPPWALYAAAAGLGLFLLLLLVILLTSRRRRKRRAAEAQLIGQTEATAARPTEGEGANIMEMQTDRSVKLRRDVRRFVEDNPEIAAQMVKNWLREEDSP